MNNKNDKTINEEIISNKIDIDTILGSLESLEIIADRMSDMICIRDLEKNLIYISKGVKKILGYTPGELKNLPWSEIVTEESFKISDEIFKDEILNDRTRDPRRRRTMELQMHHKNGSLAWVECTMSFIYDKDNNPVAFIGVDRDITSLKKATQALKMSEQRYRDIIGNANDLIFITDRHGNILLINNSMTKLLGYPEDKIIGTHYYNFIQPDYHKRIQSAINQQIKKRLPNQYYEYPLLTRTGKTIWLGQDIQIITESEKIKGFQAVAKDITKQKQAECAMKETEKKYRLLAENIPDVIWTSDLNLNLTFINPAVYEFTGYSVGESLKTTIDRYLSKESLKKAWELLSFYMIRISAKEIEIPVSKTFEFEFIHKNGTVKLGEVTVTLMFDDSGNLSGLHGITRDITERKKAETALVKSEEKYRSILENMKDAYYETDTNGNFTFLNQSACKHLEYSMDELIGMNNRKYTSPQTAKKIYEFFSEIKRSGKTATIADYEIITKSGKKKIIDMTVSIKYDTEGNAIGYGGIARDITDQKRTEEEIIKAKKIESIGILAGGIAHDFNNILTAIIGNISLARLEIQNEDMASNLLNEAEKASLRAKDLTHQLLTFSKGGIPVKKTTAIKDLLVDNTNFILTGSFIKCHFSIPANLWNAEIDEGQISQVIQNIVLNARQSMKNGGLIELTCKNVRIDRTSLPPLDPGDYVMISLQDQGSGIPEENLPDIFDPYFTTKEDGTGLGLSVAYSIIKNHNGYISVESSEGKGTSFTIYLPASHKKIIQKKRRGETPVFTGGRILLMDDDKMVIRIGEKILKKLKFDVDCAANGDEAIRLYKKAAENGDAYSAVILDLTIPGGIGGKEVMDILKEFDPDINAIVSSGYSTDMVMANYKKYGFTGIIPKPYRFEDFEKTLETVLSRKIKRTSPFDS